MIDTRSARLNTTPDKVYLKSNIRWWVGPNNKRARFKASQPIVFNDGDIELGAWIEWAIENDVIDISSSLNSYTFSQGLTEDAGEVKLGGLVDEDVEIELGSSNVDLDIGFLKQNHIATDSYNLVLGGPPYGNPATSLQILNSATTGDLTLVASGQVFGNYEYVALSVNRANGILYRYRRTGVPIRSVVFC
jgi:hypothetical protein